MPDHKSVIATSKPLQKKLWSALCSLFT